MTTQDNFVADFLAGVTVGVMLIPQSMAYAVLGNMPPVSGLYLAVVAPIAYAFLGTSMHLAIGPTSMVRLLPFHMSRRAAVHMFRRRAVSLSFSHCM